MEKALAGVPESFQDMPPGLTQINVADPSGKQLRDFIYTEQLPTESHEASEVSKPPAPVAEAKPKAVGANN